MKSIGDDDWKPLVAFHGHMCPGLAVGTRAVAIGLRELGGSPQSLRIVAETAMCSVDAVQHLTGCTLGNGDLVFRDHGKNAFTFVRLSDGRSVRVLALPDTLPPDSEHAQLRQKTDQGIATDAERARYVERHLARAQMILDLPEGQLFSVTIKDGPAVHVSERTQEAVICGGCGETVMRTRSVAVKDGFLCVPCCPTQP